MSFDERNPDRMWRGCTRSAMALRWGKVHGCVILALSLTISGCMTGEYNRRLKETATRMADQVDVATILFGAASGLDDASGQSTGVQVQLPLFVTSAAVTEDSAQPPFMKIPGFAYAYAVQSDGQPGFVYIAAVASDKAAAELTSEVQAAVGQKFSGAVRREKLVPTADGGTLPIQCISSTGPQSFGAEQVEGRFDLYLLSSPTHHVLVGWRAPVASSGFFQASEYSMGTVMVAGG